MPACKKCAQQFTIDAADEAYYKKIDVPAPTLCPTCRFQRKLVWINEMHLYSAKCALTGKDILSGFPPNVPYPVYDSAAWFSDKWDARTYGRDIDFSRPFFEQWVELRDTVPHPSRLVMEKTLVNSDYINFASNAKDCYLIFDSDFNENCYYSYTLQNCKDVMDCRRTRESQLCYECVDCTKCYNCRYAQDSQNCTDCYFIYGSNSLLSCFGCVNMNRAEYTWFNEKLSKEEYKKRLEQIDFGDRDQVEAWKKKFEEHKKKFPRLAMNGSNNVDCVGDYLINSKNARDCFDGFGVEDSRYCVGTFLPIKDSYDTYQCGDGTSLVYDSALVGFGSYNVKFSMGAFEACSDIEYCQQLRSSQNCFGSISLRGAKYCILNKQYTKNEYEKLRAKLVAHMRETGEYGEFFPIEHTSFTYNKSNAILELPLTKEEALANGYGWTDEEREWKPATMTPPANIKDVTDDILKALLADKDTGQNYKIIKQELAFYRKHNIPVPLHCFTERHRQRQELRNHRTLYDRTCDNCSKAITTTQAPDSGHKVFCRECYLKEFA